MFVCTIRKGGMRRLAAAALCGVVLAGAAFAANTIHGKAVAAAAGGGGGLGLGFGAGGGLGGGGSGLRLIKAARAQCPGRTRPGKSVDFF